MDEITRRLDYLRGYTPDVSPYDTREQNSRIIARKKNENFINQQIKQRQREISNLPKGIVNKKKSSMTFNFPDTPPPTPQEQDSYWRDVEQNWLGTLQPQPLFDYDRDFPPLSNIVPQTLQLRETSFLYPEWSVSPLRNKVPNIAPLSSKSSADNFSRPITKITNEKNNVISITPKKSVLEPIGQRKLSEQLQGIFDDVDETVKKESETFKEIIGNLDKVIDKLGKSSDSETTDQVTFELEFFTGGPNSKFNSFVKKYGLTNENLAFVDFLQLDYCKEFLQSNDLKIHIETGNIYYNDTDTNESIFEFIKNQQNTSKGLINTDLKFDGTYKNYF